MSGKDVVEHYLDNFFIGDWQTKSTAQAPDPEMPAVPATPPLGPYESAL